MTTAHLLIGEHYVFGCEVINGLNRFYGIPIKIHQPYDEDYFFNNDIRWGIATISYLFRKDFLEIFDRLKNKLKNRKQFEKYCMLITVSKNDRYFFNFLRRVALIYELAACCYRNGSDYFSRAKRCIMWYQDKVYFRDAGSWSRLNKTASFLRVLGNPLLRVILEESSFKYPLTFSATVSNIERRLIKRNDVDTSYCEEMDFFTQQRQKYLTRERDEKKSGDSQTEKERAFYQCLKSISCMAGNDTPDQISNMKERLAIIEYLGRLLSPEILNKFHKKNLSSPERTSSNVTDSFKPFDKLFQSEPNSDDQCIEREGSSIEKGIEATSSDFKGISSQKRLSHKSKNEETETNNSKFIAGDSFPSGSELNEKFSQLYDIDDLINDYMLLTTLTSFSRELARPESALLPNNSDSSYDETYSLEMPKDEFFKECSSEDKDIQQCRNENDHLDGRKDPQHSSSSSDSCSSYPDIKTPSLSSSVDNRKIVSVEQSTVNDDKGDTGTSTVDKKATHPPLLSSSVDTSKLVFVEQSAANNDKWDTDTPTNDKKKSHRQLTINYGAVSGTIDEASGTFYITVKPSLSTETNTIAETNISTEANTIAETNISTETNTIVETNIPTETNMNKSESDSNTNVDSPRSNSQPQRHRGKKSKKGKKKKGKRRK